MEYKYNLAIVLCASALNERNEFDEVDKDKKSGEPIYVGGKIRMQAAADFESMVKKIIVVGGGAEKKYECSNFKKVDDMKKFLCCENEIDSNRVIRILSEPDTTGNLNAIKKLKILDEFKGKKDKIVMLTNFYHLPRAMRMASDIFEGMNINFVSIAAEAVIKKCHPSYSFYPKEFLFRIYREINGLRDWENGKYKDQKKLLKEWNAHLHKEDENNL